MSYSYSKRSRSRLDTCDPRLVEIFEELIKFYDVTVLEGVRSEKRHNTLIQRGSTQVPYSKTKHKPNKVGLSFAIDAAPWPIPGGVSWGAKWKDRVKFYEFAMLVKYVAWQKGVDLRWGGDWDGDYDYWDQNFDDLVHFELIG